MLSVDGGFFFQKYMIAILGLVQIFDGSTDLDIQKDLLIICGFPGVEGERKKSKWFWEPTILLNPILLPGTIHLSIPFFFFLSDQNKNKIVR